jgi:hypothetical protein
MMIRLQELSGILIVALTSERATSARATPSAAFLSSRLPVLTFGFKTIFALRFRVHEIF